MKSRALVVAAALSACSQTTSSPTRSDPSPGPTSAAPAASTAAPPSPPTDIAPSGSHPRLFLGPALLDSLRARAKAKSPEWQALSARCEALASASIEWPDGNDYPSAPNVGEGYQGEGYFDPLMTLALCWQVGRAKPHATKGVDLLVKMSEASGPHAVDPLRDSGFGIRFFGVGLAIGFDWLYDAMTAADRARVTVALGRWIDAFEKKGFGRDHPQGNYFAGYYAAKGLAALATEGDDPKAGANWNDWLERVHKKMVQPYYAAHLAGGGWPEGWNYGPLATLNMTWPSWGARTAKGLDLLRGERPLSFPLDQATHLIHFTWPSRKTLDDRAIQYASDNPSMARPGLFVTLAGLLGQWSDPVAPSFHRYTRDVMSATGGKIEAWQAFLFWDPAAPEADYRSLPLSYVAKGMQSVAMRSSWDKTAIWASFTSGPYVNNPDSGEMYFDQGSLVVVRGDRALLVNTSAALQRHTPGTQDGERIGDLVYDDLYGNNDKDASRGNRTLFNIFYAKASRYGQAAVGPEIAKTRLARYEDGGAYVLMRGERLEDMYAKPKTGPRPVSAWTRQIVYVRPGTFVIDDRTSIADAATEQWLAFHVAARPGSSPTGGRLDLGSATAFGGAITSLLPKSASAKTVDVFGKGKVFRVELRPASPGKDQRWLTVFDASPVPGDVARATLLSRDDGSIRSGEAIGVLLRGAKSSSVVLTSGGARGGTLTGELQVAVPQGPSRWIVTDSAPSTAFAVTLTGSNETRVAKIAPTPGAPFKSTESGVLSFQIDAAGTATK